MSDTVIKAEGLGKKYLIGHQSEREGYTALRDVLARSLRNTLHKTRQVFQGQQLLEGDSVEEFWALKDIDFEIKRGDRVGIIGRNGAGKSTLLKVLSRITEPSVGRVEIKGRVASLLEVGTGFHPELTGRENIYLNGAILGMSRSEIKRKFDEIVDFAGVEKFLDTPVKRYSSGMYVRLAFAVAAHLEPEILVVDEVLAVGDAEFQKKCLGKMEDVSKGEGRTVLFVSHNMAAVQSLCLHTMLLENGRLTTFGRTSEMINEYMTKGISNIRYYPENHVIRMIEAVQEARSIIIKAIFNAPVHIKYPNVGFSISDKMGNVLFGTDSKIAQAVFDQLDYNSGTIIAHISSPVLLDGIYYVSFWFGDMHQIFFDETNCVQLEISGITTEFQRYYLNIGQINPIVHIKCIPEVGHIT
jgi:lipopolysaccharide transport system ATP-binding protein